ncbi:hypothetical protein [Ammoniphilus sp. 3BR4]|uniref:hypothetical protein n=1 Tax=Ammoniphilus sp. 3BR4 TaxID=3158265 RepID=UPI003466B5A0
MTEFFCILGAFFFMTGIFIERLAYGMKIDSTHIDRRDLWSSYPVTLEDMNLKE